MSGVTISPNIKKTAERIDPRGNIINPKTKQIIQPIEEEYKPTKEQIEAQINAPKEPVAVPEVAKGKNNPLAEAIKKQVQEQVTKTLAEINIAEMVKQAIEEAFQ